MQKRLSAHEASVAEAIGAQGCPVCRLVRAGEERYWDFFLYEGFQDPEAARDLRRSIGYCERHARQLAQRHDVFAFAVLAHASIEGARLQLDRSRRRRLVRPAAACPVCQYVSSTERHAIEILGRLVESVESCRERYGASDGLCYDHFTLAVELGASGRRLLEQRLRERLEIVLRDLVRLRGSFDYRSTGRNTELARAWRRAFTLLRDDPGRIT